MGASARRSLTVARSGETNGTTPLAKNEAEEKAGVAKPGLEASRVPGVRANVFVAADNRLLRETLAHMPTKKGEIEVTGLDSATPLQPEHVAQTNADVLLLTSRGMLHDDLLMIQRVRATAPSTHPAAGNGEERGSIFAVRARGNQRVFVA
jgi:hypothetical protein